MLSKSGISAKAAGNDVELRFNGEHIYTTLRGAHNFFGLYVNGEKLFVDGFAVAQSSKSKLLAKQDGLYFGEVKLVKSGTCINITAADYNTLLAGGNVMGYKSYEPDDIYNIVSNVSTASTVTYTESNGVVTFSDSTTANKKQDAVHNDDGFLSENTLDTTATMTNTQPPFVIVRYFESTVTAGETIKLDYYVDSYTMERYNADTIDDTFTVVVTTESGATSKNTTYAGHFSIETPAFSTAGRTWFSVGCIDSNGVGSVVTYFDVFVKSSAAQSFYTMQQSDLATYGIVPEDRTTSVALANKAALSSFFTAVKEGGYNGVVMLKKTYWVDYHGDRMTFPNEFTIDLNGATIAAVQCTDLERGAILKFYNNIDTHIINGFVKGNYNGFDFATTATNIGHSNPSEWLGVTACGKSHFCSFENMDISWSVGYEMMLDGGDYGTSGVELPLTQESVGKRIDISDGSVVSDSNMVASDYFSLSNVTNVSIGRDTYCTYAMGTRREYFMSFYDSSKNYISSVKTKFYQQVRVPSGTSFGRMSGYGASLDYWPVTLSVGKLKIRKNQNHSSAITYRNCSWHDTRTVAFAPAQCYQLALIGCHFKNIALESGKYKVTQMVGDLEDGWQWLQSFYMRDCICTPENGMTKIKMHYCCNIDFTNNIGFDIDEDGTENGFLTDNVFSNYYDIARSRRSIMPHVIRDRNIIAKLNVTYDSDMGNQYATETISPLVTIRDSTIKEYCQYKYLYLRRTMNGSEYNE